MTAVQSALAGATAFQRAVGNLTASPTGLVASAQNAMARDGDEDSLRRENHGERGKDLLSQEARDYLDRIRGRGWLDNVRSACDRADKLRVLFVGETIIDEYRRVRGLARPSKEPILATVETEKPEQFLGGVQAAALHGEWANTEVITDTGEPIRKTRYIEADFGRKLFEVYSKPSIELAVRQREMLRDKLRAARANVVVVFDFGHGLLDAEARKALNSDRWFLAANAQTNAGNMGFNLVTKYSFANLICVDLPEARLATGEQDGSPSLVRAILAGQTMAKEVIVTHGRNGCYCPQHIPAFGFRAVDTMGAGDAFLAVCGPLVAAGLDLEAAAFVGSVAAAIKTDIVGHRRHVGRHELLQAVECLLS